MLRLLLRAFLMLPLILVVSWAGWAGTTWFHFGHEAQPERPDALLVRFIPHYDVAERHEVMVRATPSSTFQAALRFRLEDSPVIRSIIHGREFAFSLPRSRPSRLPMVELAPTIGWGRLASVPGRERIFGAITQPWRGDVRFTPLPAAQFAQFHRSGYAKIAWTIAVDSLGPMQTRLRTETRVATTDPESRRRFRRYWAIYSPGIVLIRLEALRVIRTAAERNPRGVTSRTDRRRRS